MSVDKKKKTGIIKLIIVSPVRNFGSLTQWDTLWYGTTGYIDATNQNVFLQCVGSVLNQKKEDAIRLFCIMFYIH